MKRRTGLFISLLAIIGLIMALPGCKPARSEKPIVTVTIAPQQYFAEKIAGDKFEIRTMGPNGSIPESFDPSPGALVNLSHS